jgi:hypothetical protein
VAHYWDRGRQCSNSVPAGRCRADPREAARPRPAIRLRSRRPAREPAGSAAKPAFHLIHGVACHGRINRLARIETEHSRPLKSLLMRPEGSQRFIRQRQKLGMQHGNAPCVRGLTIARQRCGIVPGPNSDTKVRPHAVRITCAEPGSSRIWDICPACRRSPGASRRCTGPARTSATRCRQLWSPACPGASYTSPDRRSY